MIKRRWVRKTLGKNIFTRVLCKLLDPCRNLNPQGSDNDRGFVIIPFIMRLNGCLVWISKWTPTLKRHKTGYQTWRRVEFKPLVSDLKCGNFVYYCEILRCVHFQPVTLRYSRIQMLRNTGGGSNLFGHDITDSLWQSKILCLMFWFCFVIIYLKINLKATMTSLDCNGSFSFIYDE